MFYNIKLFVTFVIGMWPQPSPINTDYKISTITNPSGLSLKRTWGSFYLRLLVFDAIERVEAAIRTQIIYCLALKYNDAHWQDKKSVFKPPFQVNGRTIDAYGEIQQIIDNAKNTKHPEVFIKHYMKEYQQPANPPSWMC